VTPVPAGPEPDPWLGLGVALLVLAAAGWLAWRRGRAGAAADAPGRFVRIFYAAATFGGAMALLLGADEAARAGLTWRFLPMMALAAALLTVIALILFGLVDFWLGLAGPRRSRLWLAAALAAFVLFVTACFAIAGWAIGEPEGLIHPAMLQILAIAAAAGTVWWAHLPPPRQDVATRFE